ncbi:MULTISPECIES: FtsK/SpoIIIE domain-containing protein [unclassified Streptomyces]|uniref:FtsK/SpoIIIE domain-containing protein n=1 Tax=unclassified Streptomyces TaxID=2593676 RepID=UPI002E305BDE|nr:FtsK/SpoIIIE domain-containing protein [Streptomyces sp. NBC_01268]
MQIRLTVLAPHAGHGAGRACDVLVTAPAGTELAAVASSLAAAVSGPDTSSSGTTVLYAGVERLDTRRCVLGEPPLVDGAVLSLQVPGPDDGIGEGAPARLHVVAGPDAGGVHLLHGGAIRIGRSVDADVPLDDPDVSRAHCTVTVGPDGRVTVTDQGSTNGTTLDGAPVGPQPVRFPPGAVLRVGESALRLTGGAGPGGTGRSGGTGTARSADRSDTRTSARPSSAGAAASAPPADDGLPTAPDGEGHLRVRRAGAPGPDATDSPGDTGQGTRPTAYAPPHAPGTLSEGATYGGSRGIATGPGTGSGGDAPGDGHARAQEPTGSEGEAGIEAHSRTRQTRKRGLGAWARRLAGGKDDARTGETGEYGVVPVAAFAETRPGSLPGTAAAGPVPSPDSWPDPAAVLLTALGPGRRLWERDLDHPEALVVRLGTTDRAELSGVPVTVGLREAGSLGLAGPGARLAGLARSVVAQLAALHSPGDLEIVLISADRNRPLEERRRAWGWLGWLPHVRPGHGQDCRLLLAYDREQAQARLTELTRRLDDGPLGAGWPSADRATVAEAAAHHEGPATVVIVDGDPGSAALRETAARLAAAGAASGIHLICLAEAPSASPASPVAATYEEACASSFAFRECGAAALLSGDVATALRLLRTAGGRVAGHGTVGVVDAVSVAWAERFGRALAPLRTETAAGAGQGRSAALPPSARLLDELGLARATPASLMARWASAADGTVVLGAGPRGPVAVDLTAEGPHLLIEGPAGSGRTELLRAIAASLAAGGRPDRLGLLLVDGAGGERGEGLAACTELPHVTEHLVASDPVRMREFAQALGGELKRRAELLGDTHFADRRSGRLIGQRAASAAETVSPTARATARVPEARAGTADLTDRPSGRTLRTSGGDLGDTPSSRLPRPGTGDAGDRTGSRTPYPGNGPHTPPPGSDLLGDRTSSRTLRAHGGDLTDTPSGRLPRPGSGNLGDRAGSRTPYPGTDTRTPPPGSDLLGDRTSSRTLRAHGGDLTDTPSARLPRPGTGDPADRAGGRAPYPGSGPHTPPPGSDLLGDSPSGRLSRPGAGDLGDRPSGRAHRAGADDLTYLPSGRTGRVEGGVAAGPPQPAAEGAGSLPRLVVLVDDFDALVAPALGAPGRPAAGSVVRALEAVARNGARLGVHLIAASARPDRTVDTELAHGARLRIVLDPPPAAPGPDEPQPGRGRLGHPDGRVTPFQTGRVTGRIPRTATLRPTVVPLEWERMGDPPTRRPVRELGNGPTDLALLASALDRAARSVEATPVPPLTSPTHA